MLMEDVETARFLDNRQARDLTDRINATSGELWTLLKEANERRAWAALGYKNWRDYAVAEFNISQSRAYQLLDQAKVVTIIREAANSTNVEISEAAARDLKPVVKEVASEIKAKVQAGADPVVTTYEVIEAKRIERREPAEKPSAKPKKSEPTIESLLAENATLRDQVRTLQDNNRELASLLESYDSASEGEAAAAKALEKVKAQLRTVEATRDQWMTTAGELRREVKALRRKAGVAK